MSYTTYSFRDNALCNCNDECRDTYVISNEKPNFEFVWDGKDDSCNKAKPGIYKLELMANIGEYRALLSSSWSEVK